MERLSPRLPDPMARSAAPGAGSDHCRWRNRQRGTECRRLQASLSLFKHLEQIYRERSWVVVDGDDSGKAVVARLREIYGGQWAQSTSLHWRSRPLRCTTRPDSQRRPTQRHERLTEGRGKRQRSSLGEGAALVPRDDPEEAAASLRRRPRMLWEFSKPSRLP